MNEEIVVLLAIPLVIIAIVLLALILNKIANSYVKKHATELIERTKPLSVEYDVLAKNLVTNKIKFSKYIESLNLNMTFDCSRNIVTNAENNPLKYVIKYSNIEYDIETLANVDFCREYLTNLSKFTDMSKEIWLNIKKLLPLWVNLSVSKKAIPYIVINAMELYKFKKPIFIFSYVSPAGKSEKKFDVVIDDKITSQIVSEISSKLNKNEYTKSQRNAMTKDLREAIKKRDNYTCCICGNSVLKEPNLLLEVDHIIPVAKGGKTQADNLQTLCWRCNRSKGQDILT